MSVLTTTTTTTTNEKDLPFSQWFRCVFATKVRMVVVVVVVVVVVNLIVYDAGVLINHYRK